MDTYEITNADGSIDVYDSSTDEYMYSYGDTEGSPYQTDPPVDEEDPGFSWTDFLHDLPGVVKDTVQVISAVRNAGNPAIRAGSSYTMPNGAISTPNRNGTLTVRQPNGQIQVTQMPIGQPYTFSDGTTVVNNGTGTITTVTPSGQQSVQPIGGGSSSNGGSVTGLVLIGGALLLLSH